MAVEPCLEGIFGETNITFCRFTPVVHVNHGLVNERFGKTVSFERAFVWFTTVASVVVSRLRRGVVQKLFVVVVDGLFDVRHAAVAVADLSVVSI